MKATSLVYCCAVPLHMVRDLLHPDDLCDLVKRQLQSWNLVSGRTFNVGGGRNGSVSLQEFTRLCQEIIGRKVTITEDPATSPVDIPWYVTDHAQVTHSPRLDASATSETDCQ